MLLRWSISFLESHVEFRLLLWTFLRSSSLLWNWVIVCDILLLPFLINGFIWRMQMENDPYWTRDWSGTVEVSLTNVCFLLDIRYNRFHSIIIEPAYTHVQIHSTLFRTNNKKHSSSKITYCNCTFASTKSGEAVNMPSANNNSQ